MPFSAHREAKFSHFQIVRIHKYYLIDIIQLSLFSNDLYLGCLSPSLSWPAALEEGRDPEKGMYGNYLSTS